MTLVALGVALALAACGTPPGGGNGAPIRMNSTGSSEELAMWIAEDEGIFSEHGIDVEISNVAGAGLTPIALENGEVDLGIQTAPDFLQAVAGGLELTAVVGLSVNTPDNPRLFVMAHPRTGIVAAADLAGKRIGVPSRGGSFEVSTVALLERAGIDASTVQWVEVPFAQMAAAVEAGTVDAVATSVVLRGALQAACSTVVLDLSEFSPRTLVTFLSARSDWAQTHADDIARIREALAEAGEFATRNPERTAEIIAARTGLPAAVAANLRPPEFEPTVPPEQLRTWLDAMRDQDLLDSDLDPGTMLTP
jgi:NitT/TauT family transport system substrate-binding protein